MDEKTKQPLRQTWKWLPEQMPGVARLLAEKRVELGEAWVTECWRKGVVERQPGWFYASEGALSVGVLKDDPAMIAAACARFTDTQCFLMLATKEAEGGA